MPCLPFNCSPPHPNVTRVRGSSEPPPAGTRHNVLAPMLVTKRAPLLGSNATFRGAWNPVAQLQSPTPDRPHMHACPGTLHTHAHSNKRTHNLNTRKQTNFHTKELAVITHTFKKRTPTIKTFQHTRMSEKHQHTCKEIHLHTTHTRTHAHTHTHKHTYIHISTYSQTCTHTCQHTRTDSHIHTNTHSHTNRSILKPTNTHTHSAYANVHRNILSPTTANEQR